MAFASTSSKLTPALLLSLVVLALPRLASAQSIDPILASGIHRTYSDRGSSQNPLWVSYDDCVNDDVMQFDLKIRNNSGYSLEVWAIGSGDCDALTQRQGTSASCWLVFEDHPNSVDLTAAIPVRNIVAQNKGTDTVTPGNATSCERETSANGDNVTLWFMLVNGNGDVQGQAVSWVTTVDLSGPTAPTDVSVSAGEKRLQVKWTDNASTDLNHYDLYCVAGTATASVLRYPFQASASADASHSDAGNTDAGAAGSSGTSGSSGSGGASGTSGSTETDSGSGTSETTDAGSTTGTVTATCGVTTLVQGQRPAADLETCGTASRTGGTATGLINGITYAVGVSGVDATGNHGVLSNITCGTPEVVDDFYELYRRAGGQGGGGFCAIRPGANAARGAGPWGWVSLLVAVCLLRRRKS